MSTSNRVANQDAASSTALVGKPAGEGRAETHVLVAEHPEAAGGSIGGESAVAGKTGILRLTAMRSLERPGYVGHHRVPETWTLVLTLSGAGRVTCAGHSWLVAPNAVYLIPPGVAVDERQQGNGPWRYICMQLTTHPDAEWPAFDRQTPLHLSAGPEIRTLLHQLVDRLHGRPEGYELAAAGLCMAILGNLEARHPVTGGGRRPLVSEAIRRIDTTLACPPTVAELAARCQVSPSTLAHAFKADMGHAVHNYIQRRRVQQAKILLLGGARVNEASDRLGFCNPFHFSRVFRQHEGVSPRQFKQLSGKMTPT